MDSPFVIALGFSAFLLSVAVLSSVRVQGSMSLVLMAALAGSCGALGRLRDVVVVGGLAWLFMDGFLVNRFGDLSWHGSGDWVRFGVLLGAAGLGAATGHVFRALSIRSVRETPRDAQSAGSLDELSLAGADRDKGATERSRTRGYGRLDSGENR